MKNYFNTGVEIFNNGFADTELLDSIAKDLFKITDLDLFNSTSKYPVTEEISKKFRSNPVISSILSVLCPGGYKVMAEWFLNKKSFLPTHRDAIFFPYHVKNIKEISNYKICNGKLFSKIYFNIMVFLTNEVEGYEYFYVPNTHILDEKMFNSYFDFGVYYENNSPIFLSKKKSNDIILSATNCTEEEYNLYNPLNSNNIKNLTFPFINKGDIVLQSGSLIHGSLGELPGSSTSNILRKSYILRVCSNEYFNI